MTHALPPKPPAIAAPVLQQPVISEIEFVEGGRAFHIPIGGAPCLAQNVVVTKIIRQPSQRLIVAVSCDGLSSALEVPDDAPAAPAVKKR